MRKVAFEVNDRDQNIEITVIDLPRTTGLLPNVNRWRSQIQLEPISREKLGKALHPLEIDGLRGHYIVMTGPEKNGHRETILAAVVDQANKSWFFKLKGNSELAAREEERFKTFLQSVRFGEGTHHGP